MKQTYTDMNPAFIRLIRFIRVLYETLPGGPGIFP